MFSMCDLLTFYVFLKKKKRKNIKKGVKMGVVGEKAKWKHFWLNLMASLFRCGVSSPLPNTIVMRSPREQALVLIIRFHKDYKMSDFGVISHHPSHLDSLSIWGMHNPVMEIFHT